MADFLAFSERLYQDFLEGRLEMIPALTGMFGWRYCPEPYIWLGERSQIAAPYLCFLQINPGQPFPFQDRAEIKRNGNNPISQNRSWAENAAKMGALYSDAANPLGINRQSVTRFRKIKTIADLLGMNGVLCVEGIPLHAATFNAGKIDPDVVRVGWLQEYSQVLTAFLQDQAVLMIDAPRNPMLPAEGRPRTVRWRHWRASLAGIDMGRLTRVEGFGGPSQTLWTHRNKGAAKALYLVQGSLTLPDVDGLRKIAQAMR